jgi:hypothetical protein
MRLVRVCLIAIALMVPSRLAHADIQAICSTIAGNSANPMVIDVDVWLTRFRESYAACLSQHEAADDARVPTKDLKETHALKSGKKNPREISRIEKKVSKPQHKSTKRVIPKTTKIIQIVPANNLVNFPVPGSDAGAERWRINCSARFGGWNNASDTFLSSAGKRVSCTMRPKNARG